MEELSCVDPMTLLPCHQHLLELDLGSFGDCSSRQRQLWITKILSAISATEKVLSGKFVSQGLTNLMTPRNPPTHLCRSALGSKVHKSTTRCAPPLWPGQANFSLSRSEWISHLDESERTTCFHTVPSPAASALPLRVDEKDSALPFSHRLDLSTRMSICNFIS